MIEFRCVHKTFSAPTGEEIKAVRGLDLTVQDGELVCLIGTSGCGKTTTLRLVNRLIDPTRGGVHLDGTEVRDIDLIKLRRGIGYVIQRGGLFPHMTVARNVGLLCALEGWSAPKIKRRVGELLELVNLPPAQFADRYPRDLSGGQRQRVGVARALALDPPHILMDEPFGALDPITREQLHAEFLSLRDRMKKTIILVTHDMTEAFQLGDRVALMHKGELVQAGTEKDFSETPANGFVEDFLKHHMKDSNGG